MVYITYTTCLIWHTLHTLHMLHALHVQSAQHTLHALYMCFAWLRCLVWIPAAETTSMQFVAPGRPHIVRRMCKRSKTAMTPWRQRERDVVIPQAAVRMGFLLAAKRNSPWYAVPGDGPFGGTALLDHSKHNKRNSFFVPEPKHTENVMLFLSPSTNIQKT